MSLQSTIHKLNSDLISLFAIMDTWLDRSDTSEDENSEHSFHIRKRTIVDFLIVNKQVLAFVNRLCDEDGLLDVSFEVENAFENTPAIVRNDGSGAERFINADADKLRDILREQLFQLLCLIDVLHDKRLDAMSATLHPNHATGLDIIKSLVRTVRKKLSHYEKLLQFIP